MRTSYYVLVTEEHFAQRRYGPFNTREDAMSWGERNASRFFWEVLLVANDRD